MSCVINVNHAPKVIFIGNETENDARRISFDLSAWVEEFGAGTAQLLIKRPGEAEAYSVLLTVNNGKADWLPSSTDTAIAGTAEIALAYSVGTVAIRTGIIFAVIDASIATGTTPPPGLESWVEQLGQLAEDAQAAAADAEAAKDDAEAAAASLEGALQQIEQNKDDISALKSASYNLLDPTGITPYQSTSAAELTRTGFVIKNTTEATYSRGYLYLTLKPNTEYTFSAKKHTTSGVAYVGYSEAPGEGEPFPSANIPLIGRTAPDDETISKTFTTTTGILVIRFYAAWDTAELGEVEYSEIMVFEGTDEKPYVRHVFAQDDEARNRVEAAEEKLTELDDLSGEVDDLKSAMQHRGIDEESLNNKAYSDFVRLEKLPIYATHLNLYDKNNTENAKIGRDGAPVENSGYRLSVPVKIYGADVIKVFYKRSSDNLIVAHSNFFCAFYDENMDLVGSVIIAVNPTTVPTGAVYMRVAPSADTADTTMVFGLATGESYTPKTVVPFMDGENNRFLFEGGTLSVEQARTGFVGHLVNSASTDNDGFAVLHSDGGDSFSSAYQWLALGISKNYCAGKFFSWKKISLKWSGEAAVDKTSAASCFINSSFNTTGALMIAPNTLVNLDTAFSGRSGSLYIGLGFTPSFDANHIYKVDDVWHIDPCDLIVEAEVFEQEKNVAGLSVATRFLTSGLSGEAIEERLWNLENGGYADYALIAYGDSLTASAGATDVNHGYLNVCKTQLHAKNRISYGYGGNGSRAIAFTAGAMSGYIPPNLSTFALKYADLSTDIYIALNQLNGKTVIIDGTEYTISQTGNTEFSLPNTYTPAGYYKPVVVKNSRNTANIYVIWVGTNDNDYKWDVIDAMIAKLPHHQYVVMGLTRLGTDTTVEKELKAAEKYGSHFFNTRVQIINNAFAVLGITPTAEDATAMNSGLMPPSLLSDEVHFNDDGYEAIGKLLAEHIKGLGYSYQTE